MTNKDYYSILNVDKKSSEEDIKKSYKKLALQYHPDKNMGNDEATEKFKEISEAYSVLGNKEKRSQYDIMGTVDGGFGGEDPFSVFNSIFKQHVSSFMNMNYDNDVNIGNIFSNISGMPQSSFPFGNVRVKVHTFQTDLDQQYDEDDTNEEFAPNIGNLFKNIFKKQQQPTQRKNIETKILYDKPENIVYNINVSLGDIYNLKKKKITIERMRKKNGIYIEKKKKIEIPIYGKELILEAEGNEMKDYKNRGDVIINIFNKKDKNFLRINEYDVITNKEITLNQIYSALLYDLILPHGEIIKIQAQSFFKNDSDAVNLIQKVLNKGLPYEDDEEKICYGNLYIIYKIVLPKKMENLKDIVEIKEESEESLNIKDSIFIAYNCELDEIFNNQ
jgi:DnaJ-class molecular chaperone